MSELIINRNSLYSQVKGTFLVSRDVLEAVARSLSAINASIYGFQPTWEQISSGITPEDLSGSSLCSDVILLNHNVDALKFFAQTPFKTFDSEEEMKANAKDLLTIYLTPISVENEVLSNRCEWLYVFPSEVSVTIEDNLSVLSGWEILEYAYNQADNPDFRLSDLSGGEWEIIGTTSIHDEDILKIWQAINALSAGILSDYATMEWTDKKFVALSGEENLSGNLYKNTYVQVENPLCGLWTFSAGNDYPFQPMEVFGCESQNFTLTRALCADLPISGYRAVSNYPESGGRIENIQVERYKYAGSWDDSYDPRLPCFLTAIFGYAIEEDQPVVDAYVEITATYDNNQEPGPNGDLSDILSTSELILSALKACVFNGTEIKSGNQALTCEWTYYLNGEYSYGVVPGGEYSTINLDSGPQFSAYSSGQYLSDYSYTIYDKFILSSEVNDKINPLSARVNAISALAQNAYNVANAEPKFTKWQLSSDNLFAGKNNVIETGTTRPTDAPYYNIVFGRNNVLSNQYKESDWYGDTGKINKTIVIGNDNSIKGRSEPFDTTIDISYNVIGNNNSISTDGVLTSIHSWFDKNLEIFGNNLTVFNSNNSIILGNNFKANNVSKKMIVGSSNAFELVDLENGNVPYARLSANVTGQALGILNSENKIADGLVITSSMLSNSINGDRIVSNTMSGAKIKSGTISGEKLQDGSITTNKLRDNAVTPAKLDRAYVALSDYEILSSDFISKSDLSSALLDLSSVVDFNYDSIENENSILSLAHNVGVLQTVLSNIQQLLS